MMDIVYNAVHRNVKSESKSDLLVLCTKLGANSGGFSICVVFSISRVYSAIIQYAPATASASQTQTLATVGSWSLALSPMLPAHVFT